MRSCSVTKELRIVRGCFSDYEQLAGFHYRSSRPGPYEAIFALQPTGTLAARMGRKVVGVIVYSLPSPAAELRNIATAGLFEGFDAKTRLALINANVRCISRVVIEPRFRSLGLAVRLVRETLGEMDVPIIEAMAVMGQVNPFFARAGMIEYAAKIPARCIQLIEAFSMVGIEQDQLIDPQQVQKKLDKLIELEAEFIERQIQSFLRSYGKSGDKKPGLGRTRFVLGKLTFRPIYYVWFNPKKELRIK